MNLAIFLACIGAVAVIWYVATTVMIYEALRKRNLKVNFLFLRFLAPKYVVQYKEVTRKETGKTGQLFYHWLVAINVALLAAVLLLILSAGCRRLDTPSNSPSRSPQSDAARPPQTEHSKAERPARSS